MRGVKQGSAGKSLGLAQAAFGGVRTRLGHVAGCYILPSDAEAAPCS
jgi:hypothetical protein